MNSFSGCSYFWTCKMMEKYLNLLLCNTGFQVFTHPVGCIFLFFFLIEHISCIKTDRGKKKIHTHIPQPYSDCLNRQAVFSFQDCFLLLVGPEPLCKQLVIHNHRLAVKVMCWYALMCHRRQCTKAIGAACTTAPFRVLCKKICLLSETWFSRTN